MTDDFITLKPGYMDELRERQANVEDATAILSTVARQRDAKPLLLACDIETRKPYDAPDPMMSCYTHKLNFRRSEVPGTGLAVVFCPRHTEGETR